MTDPDIPTPTDPSAASLDGRPGLWRVLSLLVVLATVVIAVIAVLDARAAGDIKAISGGASVSIDTSRVTLGALGAPETGQVLTLGLDPSQMVPIGPDGADLTVPADSAALIALYATDGATSGLALIPAESDRSAVEISADSTARALLALSPALLQPDLALTVRQVGVIVEDPAFGRLVAALAVDSNLSGPNLAVETALADILDRVPNRQPFADQGCDSVLDPRAYAATGACIEPTADGVAISNEQDRWALLYNAGNGELCASLAPSGSFGSRLETDRGQCGDVAQLVAPGPIVDDALADQETIQRIRAAAALQIFGEYVTPFADLAAGAAGFAAIADEYVVENTAEVVASLSAVASAEPAFVAALDTLVNPASPTERNRAGIASARAVIAVPDDAQPIPGRIDAATGYLDLLGFFERVGERMTDDRTDWRWTADSVGEIAIAQGTS